MKLVAEVVDMVNPIDAAVGRRVAEFRKKRSITSSQCAAQLSIPVENYEAAEKGELRLGAAQIFSLANLFHCRPSDLLKPIGFL